MEVKDHCWVKDVDFVKLYRREPQSPCFPEGPPIDPRKNICNFSSEFTKLPAPPELLAFGKGTPNNVPLSAETLKNKPPLFSGFSEIDGGLDAN